MKHVPYLKPECKCFEICISEAILQGSGDAGSLIDNPIGRDEFLDN